MRIRYCEYRVAPSDGASPTWTNLMTEMLTFKRLERTVNLIARHPFYPGKPEAVHDCLDDLEDRYRDGSLTHEQKSILVSLLTTEDANSIEPTESDCYPRHHRSS
ncbi:hypothetical protein [Singulisphaera sp. GP187]|uniref:hypothetical protein n=1 Tax=Singulisphaera sp. GP187 TaxID=1882752 RepID=UPI0020B14514|nr:hypothetical protein [Singulisphaera sp. GP187]